MIPATIGVYAFGTEPETLESIQVQVLAWAYKEGDWADKQMVGYIIYNGAMIPADKLPRFRNYIQGEDVLGELYATLDDVKERVTALIMTGSTLPKRTIVSLRKIIGVIEDDD